MAQFLEKTKYPFGNHYFKLIEPLPPWNEKRLVLTGTGIYFGYVFDFPAYRALANSTIQEVGIT